MFAVTGVDGRAALETLGRDARDLGAPGVDKDYGRGLVAADLRTPPKTVGAAGALLR